jgi:hypothetical protein
MTIKEGPKIEDGAMTVEPGETTKGKPAVVLNVGWLNSWMGISLTVSKVRRLRDWLTKWLEENEKKGK